jgi:hypothetical protein
MILRKNFGPEVKLDVPQVRLTGVPPQEPVMQVRINAPVTRIEIVKQRPGGRCSRDGLHQARGTSRRGEIAYSLRGQ